MNVKRIITIVIVLVVLVGGFIGIRAYLSQQALAQIAGDLQTEKVSRGILESTVGATGTVRASQSATLTWQTSGTVEDVTVSLGDSVAQGDILATLSSTTLPQTVILAQADLISAQNALEDLLDSADALAVAEAERNLANAREKLDQAQEDWDDINFVGTQSDIDKAYRDMQKAYTELKDAEAERDRYDNTNSTKYKMANFKYLQAYDDYAKALGEYNYQTGQSVDEYKKAIMSADLEVARQEVAKAEQDYEDVLNGVDPDEIAAAKARVAAAEATMKAAWIEAPFAGTVTAVEPLAGDQVSAGATAFRLDDLSKLLVDVQVSEVDINQVKVGQQVILTFDAILSAEYTGVVAEVSPIGQNVSGVVNFDLTIELQDADDYVRPGMTAAANIVVSQLEEVLLVPNRAVRVIDGARVVYVLGSDGQLNKVNIELGASSDTHSEVLNGDLSEGDNIVLNPPTEWITFDGPPAFVRN